MNVTAWLATAFFALGAEPTETYRYELIEWHMGVKFKIVLYTDSDEKAKKAFAAAYARIEELNSIMSDYDPDSELSRLGKMSPTKEPVDVSRDLWHVLEKSQALSHRTEGAFDVTIGPLSRLWRRTRRLQKLPTDDRLKLTRKSVGYQFVELHPKKKQVSLSQPEMRLDLGGIAKGYAADEALKVLKKLGITQVLVDGSGDIAVGDAPPEKPAWLIGVAPLEANAPPSQILALKNCGIATSGDVWQFVPIDGKRYSHILDPQTGLGLTTHSSVTVVAPSGLEADSLASAVSVLGPKRGLELIHSLDKTELLFVYAKDDKKMSAQSKGIEKFFAELPKE